MHTTRGRRRQQTLPKLKNSLTQNHSELRVTDSAKVLVRGHSWSSPPSDIPKKNILKNVPCTADPGPLDSSALPFGGDLHEAFLSQLCIGVERDLGLVLDRKYAAAKAHRDAATLILNTCGRLKVAEGFRHWAAQTRRSVWGERYRAAVAVQRIARGEYSDLQDLV